MSTRAQLRTQSRLEYGLGDGTASDALFSDTVMNGLINRANRIAAKEARPYVRTKTDNLPAVGSEGVSVVPLDGTEFDIDPRRGSVRWLDGATWRVLLYKPEEELADAYGALENHTGRTPRWYFLRSAESEGAGADGTARELCVFPGVAAQITAGLRRRSFVFPADLANDAASPGLPNGEDEALIPVIHWLMAELESAQGDGRPNLVLRKQGVAQATLDRLRRDFQKLRTGGTRHIRNVYR